MWKKIFCRLFHKKYQEVGTSEAVDIAYDHQVWQCQWWCTRCGHQWKAWANIEKLKEPKWEPLITVRQDFTASKTSLLVS